MLREERSSSIEFLKILGIFMIILCHVVQTLGSNGNAFVSFKGYGIDQNAATTNLQYLIIAMMRYFGTIGNTIFFVCSAWFLLERNSINKKKIYLMLSDIWCISFLILIIILIIRKGDLQGSLILKSLFPNTFGNNWYLSCYMLFLAIHPMLNKIIYSLSQKAMLRTNVIMIILYLFVSFFTLITGHLFGLSNSFFSSTLIIWIIIYFIIGYQKIYIKSLSNSTKANIGLVLFGSVGNFGLIAFTNYFELKTGLLNHALQLWNVAYNPFIISLVIGLFNLAKRNCFVNKSINYISKQSLYIYLIHENHLLGTLYRPAMWNYVYINYGYNHILSWVVVLTFTIFIFSLVSSHFYSKTIHRLVDRNCNYIYPKISLIWRSIENKLVEIR